MLWLFVIWLGRKRERKREEEEEEEDEEEEEGEEEEDGGAGGAVQKMCRPGKGGRAALDCSFVFL